MRGVLARVVVALSAIGCAGEVDPADRLVGSWFAEVNDGTLCVRAVSFTDEDRYEIDFICELTDGDFGIEAEAGDYEADGDRVTFSPTHASCPNTSTAATSFSFDFLDAGQTLRLTGTRGVLALERLEDDGEPGGGGVAAFGCYDDEGYFDNFEIVEL